MIKVPNLHHLYRRMTGSLLDATVKPHILGAPATGPVQAVTSEAATVPAGRPVCYVLQEYSRSNASLIDNEAKRLGLHPPLDPMQSPAGSEKISTLFLEKNTDRYTYRQSPPVSPRLQRLISRLDEDPAFDVDLVPVTVLWGRAPDNEESWFKLLMTDAWSTPGALKQMLNVGIHRNETYVQFHPPVSLRKLYNEARERAPESDPGVYIYRDLFSFLSRQREVVLGPDLAERQNVMSDLFNSQAVQDTIQHEVATTGARPAKVEETARKYLDEIVADYSYPMIRFYDHVLTWLWNNLYDGVEVHNFQQVRQLADDYEIVYAPAHRSHIDYLLMSFVIYKRGMMVPYIAAGDNLNLPALGRLLRGGGAFFIRRSFKGNQLYTAVLREYVYSILKRNTPMECFIEGGRSRSGRLLPPKQGFLGLIAHASLRSPKGKPIVFIPTYFGYERLMEGGTYVGELQGKPKERESLLGLLKTTRKIERIFGKVHVSFGEPVFLDQVLRANNVTPDQLRQTDQGLPPALRSSLNDLSQNIMQNINRSAVINPVNLMALVILATPRHTLDESMFVQQVNLYRRLAELAPYDDHVELTPLSGGEVLTYGQKLKMLQQLVHPMGNMIAVDPAQAVLLTYFRNNVVHLFMLPSLIAAIIQRHGSLTLAELVRLVEALYPYLKAELFLKWEQEQLPELVRQYVLTLGELGLIHFDMNETADHSLNIGPATRLSPSEVNAEALRQLQLLAAPSLLSMERYFIVLAILLQQPDPLPDAAQLEELGVLLGQKLSLVYEFNSPDFFDRNVFRTFIQQLQAAGSNGPAGLVSTAEQLFDTVKQVLDPATLTTLKQHTSVTDEERRKVARMLDSRKQKQERKKTG